MQIKDTPKAWKAAIVGFALLHFFVAILFENLIAPGITKLISKVFKDKSEKKKDKKLFKKLKEEFVVV